MRECVFVCVAGWEGAWRGRLGGARGAATCLSSAGATGEKKRKAWKCQGASTLLIVMRLTVSLHPLCPQSILPGCLQTTSSTGGATRRVEHSELRGFVRRHKNAARKNTPGRSDIHTPDKRPTSSFPFGAQQADVEGIFTKLVKSLFFHFNNGVRDVLSQQSSSSKLSFPNPGLLFQTCPDLSTLASAHPSLPKLRWGLQ